MIRLYLASSNPKKLQELKALINEQALPIEVYSINQLGLPPKVEETATTFEGNAHLKAHAYKQFFKERLPNDAYVLAEDSGLAIDCLGGAPGVYSARYAGKAAADQDNIAKVLKEIKAVPAHNRRARFICVLVLLRNNTEEVFRGECLGSIAQMPLGEKGFGYDPLFIPEGYQTTFAQLGSAVKNKLSHRKKAIAQMLKKFFQ